MQENPFGKGHAGGRVHFKPYGGANAGCTWQTAGGIIGLGGGLVAILFGTVSTALSWLTASPAYVSHLRAFGTALFFFSIPLLIVGAHCLDLSDRRRALSSRAATPGRDSKPEKKTADEWHAETSTGGGRS